MLGATETLRAQDLQTGYARYLQGEFANAEGIYQNLLAGDLALTERAKVLKLLGLTQYMQGKRSEAAESFKLAKKFAPSTRLSNEEVMDETVRDFFNSIEGPPPSALKAKNEPPKKKESKKEAAGPPAIYVPPPPHEEVPNVGRSNTNVGRSNTEILILSNVLEARILVDGFFRGRMGDIISVDPGVHNVEIYARGYKNFVQNLSCVEGRLNRFQVELQALAKTPAPETPAQHEAKKHPHRKKHTHKPKTEVSEDISPVFYFMPFGVPQYMQGKIWTGVGFSAAQTAGLGFFVVDWLQANSVVTDTNDTIAQRDAQEAKISDPGTKAAFAKQTDDYYSGQQATINQLRTNAYIGLGVFILAWVGSGLEAYFNPPIREVSVQKSELKERREKTQSWSLVPWMKNHAGRTAYTLNFSYHF